MKTLGKNLRNHEEKIEYEDILRSFNLFKNKSNYQSIYNYLDQFIKKENFNENEKSANDNINLVFSRFLYKIFKFLDLYCFREILVFICLFARSMNEIGFKGNQYLYTN